MTTLDIMMWAVFAGLAIAVALTIALVILLVLIVIDYFKQREHLRGGLPYPDISAERMYDIQYFYRAIGRTDK